MMAMLGLLDEPRTEKLGQLSESLSAGVAGHSAMQGWRLHMEDACIMCDLGLGYSLIGVFDGHAGSSTAKFAAANLRSILQSTTEWAIFAAASNPAATIDTLGLALIKAFVEMDSQLRARPEVVEGRDMSGSTAIVAVLTPMHIVVANLGDSRCVLRSGGKAISMSEDHKPECPEEAARISQAGGFVADNRVNGELAMSRALGDFRYKDRTDLHHTKQKVICVPDIAVHERTGADELLLLACDGVFDVMSNSEAVEYLHKVISVDGLGPVDAAADLVDLVGYLHSIGPIGTNSLTLS